MHFSTITFIVASSMISVASAALFNVTVAKDHKLTYDPPFLTGVKNGDIIGFQFATGTHTVTQSTLDKPCDKKAGGSDSGIISAAGNPSWTLTVDDASAPLWFQCVPHCTLGMVFAINPPDNTFDTFSAAARGQTQPSASGTASSSASSSTTATATGATPSGTTTSTSPATTSTNGTPTTTTSINPTSTTTASTGVTPSSTAGALGQVSASKVALWLSTLGVVVCLMI